MEKRGHQKRLLIEPFGIEMYQRLFYSMEQENLLIEPFGIEI